MDRDRWKQLQQRGWTEGSPADFLGLAPEEAAYVEIRLQLAGLARNLRKAAGSSQSRVAKLEAADPSVSLDLMVRSILSLGGGKEEIAESMGRTN